MVFTTEVRVPPEVAFVSLVEAFVADAASRCELAEQARRDAVAAARIGFAAIVEEALAESREPVRVVASCTPAHFALSFFERGLPMDDALARRDPRWNELTALVDDAHWRLHGTGGSELRLFVKRPAPGGAIPSAKDRVPAEVVLAPPQRYVIRRFQPRDAEGVARAFYLTYGYAYDMPAVYTPARLTELNESGEYASIVALDDAGEVVGHYALAREREAAIADACGAIVVPAHRGRDLLNRLREQAEREAISLGLAAYYSEPVTDHPRTQAASESFGAKACGITLGEAPRGFLARHMKLAATTQRQSCMLYVKVLQPRESRTIYLPERHRSIVSRIYEELGLPIAIGKGVAPSGRGEFRSAIAHADAIATIDVSAIGKETAALIRQAADDLRAGHRLGAIYAALPLEDAGTPSLVEALESYGLFFAGVGPWMLGGKDALRMQLPLTAVDPRALVVVGEFGKALLEYIEAERNRLA